MKHYWEYQQGHDTTIVKIALIFTIVFQLVFSGFVFDWSLLLRSFAFWIVIFISYRLGVRGCNDEWKDFIKEEGQKKDFHKKLYEK